MTVGVRIKQKRTELGWSRLRLSKETGIPVTTLATLEYGRSRSSTSTALIAKALGVDPLWLSGEIELPAVGSAPAPLAAEEGRLLSLFRMLPASDKALAIRIIRGLAASSEP